MQIKNIKELNEMENEFFKILVDKGEVVVVAKFDRPRVVCNWKEEEIDLDELSYFGFDVELIEPKEFIVVYDKEKGDIIATDLLLTIIGDWDKANEYLKQYEGVDGYVFKRLEI